MQISEFLIRPVDTKIQFIKFLVVGGINTIFGYSCFAILIYLGLHYTLAVLFGTILGILFNFMTTGALVFRSTNYRRLLHFTAVYGFLYFINIGWLRLMELANVDLYIGGALAILPVALLGFLLNKKFVFKGK